MCDLNINKNNFNGIGSILPISIYTIFQKDFDTYGSIVGYLTDYRFENNILKYIKIEIVNEFIDTNQIKEINLLPDDYNIYYHNGYYPMSITFKNGGG